MKELNLKAREGDGIKKGIWFLSEEEFDEGDQIMVEHKFVGFIKRIKRVEIYPSQRKQGVVFSKTFIHLLGNDFRPFDKEYYHLIEEYYTVDNLKVQTTLSLESKKYNG